MAVPHTPSPLRFAGYNFPAAFRLEARQQDSVINEVQIPFMDGTSAPQGKRDSKKVHVKGVIGGQGSVDLTGNFMLTRDQVEDECNAMDFALGNGYGKLLVGRGVTGQVPLNICPDSDIATPLGASWTDQSSGAIFESSGVFRYNGTGAASGFLFVESSPIDVVPGQWVTVFGTFGHTSSIISGRITWGVYDTATLTAIGTVSAGANQDGSYSLAVQIPAGVYSVVLLADTANATVQTLAGGGFVTWSQPMLVPGNVVNPSYVSSVTSRYLLAQKQTFAATYWEAAAQLTADVDILFVAQDPRWLSLLTRAVLAQAPGATPAAVNNGSAIVYPKMIATFTGACANVQFQIQPAGFSPGQFVAVTVTPPGGFVNTDVLVIDCDPRNRANAIKYNGAAHLEFLGTGGIANTLGNAAFFPYMLGGSNVAKVDKSGGGGANFTWGLYWQDAWNF